jgi:hypothetical protein
MKKLATVLMFSMFAIAANAQVKAPALDKSPMDMSYYPDKYPILKLQDKVNEPMAARVIYSRPQRTGRELFGKLIDYGKVWRLGANEATEIEFFTNVKIKDVKIKKGRYTLYSIPQADKWTFIINSDNDSWGSFKYEEKKDLVRIDVPVETLSEPVETLSMVFEKANNNGIHLVVMWDNVKVALPITLQ